MSVNSGSGGVRNLRAMFENKAGDQSNSPPSRGRSPSGSINSSSSRPVSKVRASFVAVEKPGDIGTAPQWGLRKASDVSSMAEVKDNETASNITRTQTVESQAMSPTSPHTSKDSIDGGLGSILKGSAFEGTPRKPSEPAKPDKPESNPNGVGSRAAEMIKKMQPNEKSAPPPPTKVATSSDAKTSKIPNPKPLVKPPPDFAKAPKLDKASPKTPTEKSAAKTPTSPANPKPLASMIRGGPAKIKGVMESAKRSSDAREAIKKDPPNPLQKPTETQTRPTTNGVKKDKVTSPTSVTSPRSPTKPMKLPSAATATTAAAAAKHEAQPPAQPPARRVAPRASMPAMQSRATGATTASSLHQKTSRASLAPNGSDRPKSRVSTTGKTDSGFLERMMRPTQSSSQKTHEKVPVSSPPRSKPVSGRPKASSLKGSRKSDQSEIQGAGGEEPYSPVAITTEAGPNSSAPANDDVVPEPQSNLLGGLSDHPTKTGLSGTDAAATAQA